MLRRVIKLTIAATFALVPDEPVDAATDAR
jgi:hypothetical protein